MTHHEIKLRNQRIIDALRSGHGVAEIAQRENCTLAVVYQAAFAATLSIRALKPCRLAILADLLHTRCTLQAIGDRHQCSRQYVHQVLAEAIKAGIKIKHRSLSGK